MRHDLKIRISHETQGPAGSIVRCRTVMLRERLLNRLFGAKRRVTIIIPGDTVECVSVHELPEGGAPP